MKLINRWGKKGNKYKNKTQKKEFIARCYLSAVIIDCYWYSSLFIRLYFNGCDCTQSQFRPSHTHAFSMNMRDNHTWNDMWIVMQPYVWSTHTLSTRRHFNVNYHQISWIGCFVTRFYISREMKCLIQWILLSSVTSAFFTIVWTLFGIICHTYTHEQTSKHTCNWGIVVSNPINKTNWTVIYDQNFKMMISTLYSSCCLAFRLMT